MRPYETLVGRFPQLLVGRLARTLAQLQQRAPPELAAVDLALLSSQQPTLLLAKPEETVAAWRRLQAVCAGVPAWAQELHKLSRPTMTLQQLAERRQAAKAARQAALEQRRAARAAAKAAAVEAAATAVAHGALPDSSSSGGGSNSQPDSDDQWLAQVYAAAGVERPQPQALPAAAASPAAELSPAPAAAAAAPAAPAGKRGQPAWLTLDPQAQAVAATHGAFGSLQRPWRERDRVRVRALSRLLAARPWQLARLEYLAARAPQQAGQRGLLDEVMAPRAAFEAAHPAFLGWLDEQKQAARQAREARRAEREAQRAEWRAARDAERAAAAAAAEGEAPGGPAASFSDAESDSDEQAPGSPQTRAV